MKGLVKIYQNIFVVLISCNREISSLFSYDFLYIVYTLPHNSIMNKLTDLIKRIFQSEGSVYISCNDRHAVFTSDAAEIIIYGLVRECVKLPTFSKTIFILDLALNYIDK